jgi:hypothetical protein
MKNNLSKAVRSKKHPFCRIEKLVGICYTLACMGVFIFAKKKRCIDF